LITDNGSPTVLEIRFDHPLSDIPKSCPETSLAYWYLESGLPVGYQTRVSVFVKEDMTSLQIIGTHNNGDSQGIVKLTNQRPTLISAGGTLETKKSIISCHLQTITVNSGSYFKILSVDNGLDFPLFISQSKSDIAVSQDGRVFTLSKSGQLDIYDIDKSGGQVGKTQIFHAVKCFGISHSGDRIVLQKIGETSVEIYSQIALVSEIKLGRPVHCLCVNDYGDWIGLTQEESQSSQIVGSLVDNESIRTADVIALSNDWFVHILGLTANISPIYDLPASYEISNIPSTPSKLHIRHAPSMVDRNRACVIISGIPGHEIVLNRDFFRGSFWSLIPILSNDLPRDSLAIIGKEHVYSMEPTAPYRVNVCSFECKEMFPKPVMKIQSVLAACLDSRLEFPTDWPDDDVLRSMVEPLVKGGEEVSRSTDNACRKFLISWYLCQITTESIAWAIASDTQAYIVKSISETCDARKITWDLILSTGMAIWCNEISLLREVIETIQKSALSDYMKSRDVSLLDTRVIIWLAALGKQQLIAALYKQHATSCASPGHGKISEFFSTNFSNSDNMSKAIKNAFELLKQKRYHMSVTVFWLAGSYREAVDVCCRQLGDVSLAIALLKMLKLTIPSAAVVADDLIKHVWESRLLANGDVWMRLAYQWLICEYPENLDKYARSDDFADYLPFARMNPNLSRHSQYEFLQLLRDRLKRLNRTSLTTETISVPVSDSIASYIERGLPDLAHQLLCEFGEEVPNPHLKRTVLSSLDN